MQDVLKCMMDEQVLRHLEKVELFEDWFSVIGKSVFEGKSIDIQHSVNVPLKEGMEWGKT